MKNKDCKNSKCWCKGQVYCLAFRSKKEVMKSCGTPCAYYDPK